MLIPLLLLASAALAADPPIRVSFNDDGKYVYGDKGRVYVQAGQDGYLVVLRSDARGNLRVLSPVDPGGDQQIHGGKKYEIKDRGGREAFVAEDTAGQGVVLAAWSRTPFDVGRYQRNGRWDNQALNDARSGLSTSDDDPESRLLGVVDAIQPEGHYEYDVATYVVFSPRVARAVYRYPYPYVWGGGWWGYDPWFGGPFLGPRVFVGVRRFGFPRHW